MFDSETSKKEHMQKVRRHNTLKGLENDFTDYESLDTSISHSSTEQIIEAVLKKEKGLTESLLGS
jgi:hypothetical protein